MDKDKFNQVLEYFQSEGLTLQTDVKNAIEDAFKENDNIENVQCYYKNELDAFEKDLTLTNKIDIYTDGHSIGSVFLTFTYFGQLDFSLSEFTTLLERDEKKDTSTVIEKINEIDNTEISSRVYDADEYNIVLLETLTWNTPEKPERHDQLFIYCPDLTIEEEEKDADK